MAICALAGCATQTQTVHVTEARQPVPIADVKFMGAAPSNAICLAEIFAETSYSATDVESAQLKIKQKAAALGANVVVLQNRNSEQMMKLTKSFEIEGQAYFIPTDTN